MEETGLGQAEVLVDEAIDGEWMRPYECDWNWVAIYGDSMALTQFGEDGERSFGDIDQDRLVGFFITNGPEMLGVDLTRGEFVVNNLKLRFPEADGQAGLRRLIYFRRHTEVFSFGGGEGDSTVLHCVGWQCEVETDGGPRSEKRIIGAMTEWDGVLGQNTTTLVVVEE